MEEDLLKNKFDVKKGELMEKVKDMKRDGGIDVDKGSSKKPSSRPGTEDILETFKEDTGKLKKNEMKPDLVRKLKQVDESEERELKDADKRFLEMVEEAEETIEKTMSVAEKNPGNL